jgi:hypothetical protein
VKTELGLGEGAGSSSEVAARAAPTLSATRAAAPTTAVETRLVPKTREAVEEPGLDGFDEFDGFDGSDGFDGFDGSDGF